MSQVHSTLFVVCAPAQQTVSACRVFLVRAAREEVAHGDVRRPKAAIQTERIVRDESGPIEGPLVSRVVDEHQQHMKRSDVVV
jgi:hypothetical protein